MSLGGLPGRASAWRPTLGAWPEGGRPEGAGFAFRVWAPARQQVELVIGPPGRTRTVAMTREANGTFAATVPGAPAGERYAYLLDGTGPFPDPASRSQPDGVHQPSALVDPGAFAWSDRGWRGVPLDRAIIYELHVGTFTIDGTFGAAIARLPDLVDLGITVVEIMPVAAFPGRRNWGYDGVSLFAPAGCYGTPDDLRALVDAAHALGLAVLLDVVYNHFGPDGAYHTQFSPYYTSTKHRSPWGAAVNLDGEESGGVRAFFIENALHWLHEYHFDGLRLDATHALVDDSPSHLAADLADEVRRTVPHRHVLLAAEDDRNLAAIVKPRAEQGWGFDAVWADDLHHQLRRLAAGDHDGYFQDFSGSTTDAAATLRQGWFYAGQHSSYRDEPRGTDPAGVPLERMIVCLQNHDQTGNRPLGTRLHHEVEGPLYRALSTVLLLARETPLLFMGQEWAASAPFLYFTDHGPELGRLVTEGRRKEFARFEGFADERSHQIPDPQGTATFERSRLQWRERSEPPHAGTLALYRALLRLRQRRDRLSLAGAFRVTAPDSGSLAYERVAESGQRLLVVARLREGGTVDLAGWQALRPHSRWSVLLTTEDEAFCEPADRGRFVPRLAGADDGVTMTFARAGAAILGSA